jgi:hypothetical protein
MARSGFASFWSAIATPGRALPAAQPQTELTTTSSVPFASLMACSTCSGVRVSSTPIRVKSSRIGLMRISEYGMFLFLLAERLRPTCPENLIDFAGLI